MKNTTANRILEYIRQHGQVSAPQLSRDLSLTIQDVRYHLTKLADSNWIEAVSLSPSGRRGRPAHIFQLTSRSSAREVSLLLDAILSEMDHNLDLFRTQVFLEQIAQRIVGPLPASSSHQVRQINWAVHALQSLRYKVRWEARPDGAHIWIGSSPFQRQIQNHFILKNIDRYILEYALRRKLIEIPATPTAGFDHEYRF